MKVENSTAEDVRIAEVEREFYDWLQSLLKK